jgi:hypothetical protein
LSLQFLQLAQQLCRIPRLLTVTLKLDDLALAGDTALALQYVPFNQHQLFQ